MISKVKLEILRNKYKSGTRIKLIRMDDIQYIESGATGTVDYVDDDGQIQMKWDDGRTLALIDDVDDFVIIKDRNIER